MILHNHPLFTIYFGDASDGITLDNLSGSTQAPFSSLKKRMRLNALLLCKQVHGDQGLVVTPDTLASTAPFSTEGDFLCTQEKRVGLGVLTADCLPIIFYDSFANAVAIVHAGWRGSAADIAVKAVESMQAAFDSKLKNIRVFFGPSAKSCCYVIAENEQDYGAFIKNFEHCSFLDQVFKKRGERFYFDLSAFNRLRLEELGIARTAFRDQYNTCTMCDERLCSSRRTGAQPGRQVTVVSLT